MAGKKIFISYRRQDAGGEAGRLADNLQEVFQHDRVFMDVDTIEPGADFVEVINNAVSSCDVMLVMIGPHWANIKDAAGSRRLDNPDDFVRLEIGAALKRNIRVIPVLVNGAGMPSVDQLPAELEALTRRHAHELSSSRWKFDSEQLIVLLEKLLGIKRKEKEEDKRKTVFIPTPPKKSWWAKNYLWVLGTMAVIIILLSIPDTDDFYIEDDKLYPEQQQGNSQEEGANHATIDEQVTIAENPVTNRAPNLAGLWAGVNTYGQNYTFEIAQKGDVLNFTEYNHYGIVSANGSGTIFGREIELEYHSILEITGDIELTLSADGQTLEGMIYLPDDIYSPIVLVKAN